MIATSHPRGKVVKEVEGGGEDMMEEAGVEGMMVEVVVVEALMEVLAEDEVGSMVVGGEDMMAMEEGEVALKADEEEVVKEGEDSAEVEEEAAIRGEEEEVARDLEGSRGTRGNPVPTRSDGLRGEEGVAIEKYITSLNLRISKHVGALRHLKRVWCENLYPQFVEYTIHRPVN